MTSISRARRGPEETTPVLVIPRSYRGRAKLRVPHLDGRGWHAFLLSESTTNLLRALSSAWMEDRKCDLADRGFRTRSKLAHALSSLPFARGMKREESVGTAVSRARAELRAGCAAFPPGVLPELDLIETEKNRGYRIGTSGIDVVFEPVEE